MAIKNATSFTLRKDNLRFLDTIAKAKDKSRSDIVDSILGAYRKFRLKKEIMAGFGKQSHEDISDAMSDFRDYLTIIDKK